MIRKTVEAFLQRTSLSQRLAAVYSLAVFILLGCGAVVSYATLDRALRVDAEAFVENKAHALGMLLTRIETDPSALRSEIEWQVPALQYHRIYARIYGPDDQILAETSGIDTETPKVSRAKVLERFRKPTRFQSGQGHAFLGYAIESPPYVIQVAMDLSRLDDLREEHSRAVLAFGILGAVIALFLGWVLGRVIMLPVRRLVTQTAMLRPDRQFAIESQGFPVELRPVAKALNTLHGRVHEQVRKLAGFAEDLAHEMRNPINVLIGEAELALSRPRTEPEYQETLQSALEEYHSLAQLVDSLLFIARAENRTEALRLSTVRLEPLISELIEVYLPLAEEKRMSIHGRFKPESLVLTADPILIKRAVANLIANAVSHGSPGTQIEVGAEPIEEGRVRIFVQDQGPGIAPEHLPRLFDRFYRVGASQSAGPAHGSGLGLPIVQSIVSLHRGEVRVQSEVGKGSRFEIILPEHPSLEAKESNHP